MLLLLLLLLLYTNTATITTSTSAADVIYENVDADANIIFGALVDQKISNGEVKYSAYVYVCIDVLLLFCMYACMHVYCLVY